MKPDKNRSQKKCTYSIGPKGKIAVKKWLRAMEIDDFFPDDPIRTRFQYAHMLSPSEQIDWLNGFRDALLQQNRDVKVEYGEEIHSNAVDQYILKGILDTNRMRLRWVNGAFALLQEINQSK